MARDNTPAAEEPELAPFRLNRLMAAWNNRLEDTLAASGASFAQWRVVMVAARAGRPLSIIELAAWTQVPHSTLSRQLAAMEREGLLTRVRHRLDGRAVAVSLTPQGRARYREWLPLALSEAEAVLGTLTTDDRAAFGRMLRLLESAVEHPQPSASMA